MRYNETPKCEMGPRRLAESYQSESKINPSRCLKHRHQGDNTLSLRYLNFVFPSTLTTITNKTVDTNGSVHATTNQLAIAESNTVDGSFVACERTLVLPRARIPDLDGLVFSARDKTQAIGRKGPNTFHVTEKTMHTSARRSVPESNGSIQRASQHVSRRKRSRGIMREKRLRDAIWG